MLSSTDRLVLAAPAKQYYGRSIVGTTSWVVWLVLIVPFGSHINLLLGVVLALFGLPALILNVRWLFYPREISVNLEDGQVCYRTLTGKRILGELTDVEAIACRSFGFLRPPFRIVSPKGMVRVMTAPTAQVHAWADAVALVALDRKTAIDLDIDQPWKNAESVKIKFTFTDTRKS